MAKPQLGNAPGKQQGVALMIVLMIVALVAVLATEMGTRLQLQVQRTMNLKDNNQAYWYAMGAEAFARKSIQSLVEESPEVISIDQPWAQEFSYPLENGGLTANLEDLQACFNLNAITSGSASNNANSASSNTTEAMEAFHTMLLSLSVDGLDNYTADTLRDSLADWVDDDDNMRPYGAEDSEYESREFPYLAANGPLASKSELRIINGVSPEWLNALLPLVCVIPDYSELKINVNTLEEEDAPLLAGLTGLDIQQAASLLSSRPQNGWDDTNAFLSEPSIQALNLTSSRQDWFSVKTEYFMLHTKTQYNKATFKLSTVFHASADSGVNVVNREFGGTY
ncbi:general secretion pathway protein GspK [Alteromonas mediterranea]|uniref:Type II secretion system protein K n=1 Tax=Alteromonas mediterranea TaxID=314275 RepID=A0AAC9AEP2_9ALTE|nr:general secretion pathway protein GspK [Alteromonas mediterranea]MBR9896410.1 type II secretion system minor pseudopilin GspK [Gammaproteobacteria bacterium]NQY17119.1 type II secretion system minor pseudopilin GspK [Alteromonas sp.]AMJ84857.1 general secretion pathway protein GspK [Alteromonas mediterranea]APD91881.1 general secretion pathway protein GspK [Alteromonas mediterranea]